MSAPGLIPDDLWREYLAALVKDPRALARHCADLAEAAYGRAALHRAEVEAAVERGARTGLLEEAADRYADAASLFTDAAGVILGRKSI